MVRRSHPESELETKLPRILVVDDDDMVRDVVVESIRMAGYNVDETGDGEQALAENAACPYDIIVTDMKLPGLDGLSLIKKLKSSGTDTDVIVITGYGSIENAVECMKAGALDYIIKPVSVDQIQLAARKALEHRELRRRALAMELYRELSYLDPLTQIHNRRYFDETLDVEIQKCLRMKSQLVLVMIDIDDFKLYNDRNGHQKGDEALAKMGQLFTNACRVYDVITRYGGEEFAIIFPGAGTEHTPELARRILREVRCASFDGAEALPTGRLTVSVGAACFPDHARTKHELIRRADEALYEAKRVGKNTARVYGSDTELVPAGADCTET